MKVHSLKTNTITLGQLVRKVDSSARFGMLMVGIPHLVACLVEVHLPVCRRYLHIRRKACDGPWVSVRKTTEEPVVTCVGSEARLPGLESQVYQLLILAL